MSYLSRTLWQMIDERKKLFYSQKGVHLCSDERSPEVEKKIDELALEIRTFITTHQDDLGIDDIIEGLTMLGAAPSIIYDDNGHFMIGGDGMQNMPDSSVYDTQETEFSGTWFVPAGAWKPTIREAIKVYLEDKE